MAYKKGNVKLLQENNLNAKFYLKYLEQEFGIRCFEWEKLRLCAEIPGTGCRPECGTSSASAVLPDEYLAILHVVCGKCVRGPGQAAACDRLRPEM